MGIIPEASAFLFNQPLDTTTGLPFKSIVIKLLGLLPKYSKCCHVQLKPVHWLQSLTDEQDEGHWCMRKIIHVITTA